MWLIDTATFHLTEFTLDAQRPKYAILSHRWIEGEEVTFQEMRSNGLPPDRSEISQCCKLARAEGIAYAWVDTCCIDKTSSAELTEAINSMYHWYADSEICYAYLADVHVQESSTLTKSSWFTRGWTLQELIAPEQVLFYDHGWTPLGSRSDLSWELSYITGIAEAVLAQQKAVNFCSIAERMSWASRRTTTRKEDMAYGLLGLFQVNMPMLYGEGGERAFLRLQEEIIKSSDD
ncbi:HET-domain-containing protein, partial [Rhizodiscina lignyota]